MKSIKAQIISKYHILKEKPIIIFDKLNNGQMVKQSVNLHLIGIKDTLQIMIFQFDPKS